MKIFENACVCNLDKIKIFKIIIKMSKVIHL